MSLFCIKLAFISCLNEINYYSKYNDIRGADLIIKHRDSSFYYRFNINPPVVYVWSPYLKLTILVQSNKGTILSTSRGKIFAAVKHHETNLENEENCV